jgi:myo-inositol-1(or 4)-monophosphatase
MTMHLLQIAKKLAHDAGKMAMQYQAKGFSVDSKGGNPINYVTEADKAEAFILKTIESFPDHSILSEERGAVEKGSGYKWIMSHRRNFQLCARHSLCHLHRRDHKTKPIVVW